jgi:hypothetical protein
LPSENTNIKICRTIILPVVLYGYETWSLTLREEHKLRMFENRVLGKILGPKREMSGEDCITRSFMICTLHQILYRNQIKKNEMGGVWRYGGQKTCMQSFGGET